jgi:HSP20 family protein
MSNLIRWDPFREMSSLRRAVDRIFDDALVGSNRDWQPFTWDLALDVLEKEDGFVVKASVPGINPNDLEITYSSNTLTIKGELHEESEVEESQYHLKERRQGSFSRSISLPSNVNADKIQASYEAGVLTLNLPKVEEAKPKRINVKSGDTPMIEGTATDIKSKN